MTAIVFHNVVGKDVAEPVLMDRRRRRLSTLVKAHAPTNRPFIVSVHRKGDSCRPDDRNVRLRAMWKDTFVSGDNVVLITHLPLGGGSAGGGASTGKQVGSAIALVALAIAAPGVGTAVSGALGAGAIVAKAVAAGVVIGNIWRLK